MPAISLSPTAPIALFDSGAGGIGVLREVEKLLPREQFLYFGDTANAPYGERDPHEIRALVLHAAERLLQEAKALVLACNTATAIAAAELRRLYPTVPIIGMEPALAPAVSVCAHPRILVLATNATLHQEKYRHLQEERGKTATVFSLPAPGIVRLVEAGLEDAPEMDAYLYELLSPWRQKVDGVVLGCTHFPFAAKAIRRVLGADVPLFDGASGTARETKRRLQAAGLLSPARRRGTVTLCASNPTSLTLFCRLYHAKIT